MKKFIFAILVVLLFFASCSEKSVVITNSVSSNSTNASNVSLRNVTNINLSFNKLHWKDVCFPNASVVKHIFGNNVDLSKFCILNKEKSEVSNASNASLNNVLNNTTSNLTNSNNIVVLNGSSNAIQTLNSNSTNSSLSNGLMNLTSEQLNNVISEASFLKTIVVNETQAVQLKVNAYDPDGRPLKIFFSKPLNASGFWQTKMGDYGTYIINITASDGKLNTTAKVRLIVKKLNLPPKVYLPSEINVSEGQVINITPKVVDLDNNPITINYVGWLSSPVYHTTYSDAGTYHEKIIVSNGYHNVTKYVTIHVKNVDRAPVVRLKQYWNITGGSTINLNVSAYDPDNDTLTYYYFKPFNSKGIWHAPKLFNGTVHTKVIVSDGTINVTKDVLIDVTRFNTPPYFITTNKTILENETFNFMSVVRDNEGDPLKLTISGLNSTEKYFDFNSAGVYHYNMTVCDYEYCNSTNFTLIVKNVNRPPVVTITQNYVVPENSTLKADVSAYDPDGDNVTITCGKPFVNCIFKTNFSSAGKYRTTINVSDGNITLVYPVNITVTNVDRPPKILNISNITVKEGQTISISPVIVDPDNDTTRWWLKGWLNKSEYTTNYNDSGVYNETIYATDGNITVSKNFTITVINVDRPPVITGVILE